jgi:anti-anti-sigma regulatory factor
MDVVVSQAESRVPVTIMALQGELDASNYLDLVARARGLYEAGTRDLLLELSDLSFMASSGLVALHSIALIMRGEEPPDPEHGWGAFRALAKDKEGGYEAHCKLCNPQASVAKTLEMTGFNTFLEVFADPEAAISSF